MGKTGLKARLRKTPAKLVRPRKPPPPLPEGGGVIPEGEMNDYHLEPGT